MKITFNDGSTLEADVNASTYITEIKPNFPEDLTKVILTDETETTLYNVEVFECYSPDGRFYFGFRELSKGEVKANETDKRIDELAENLSQTDLTAVEIYEALLAQTEINDAQDLSIVEIYETLGGM